MNPTCFISVPGELVPYEQVDLFAKVNGFVKKNHVDRGARVYKNQLLVELEAPEINQKYYSQKSVEAKMESEYVFAKQAFERLNDASKTEGRCPPSS